MPKVRLLYFKELMVENTFSAREITSDKNKLESCTTSTLQSTKNLTSNFIYTGNDGK